MARGEVERKAQFMYKRNVIGFFCFFKRLKAFLLTSFVPLNCFPLFCRLLFSSSVGLCRDRWQEKEIPIISHLCNRNQN